MDARHDANQSARRSIRLRGFDYAQEGAYFVTICTHHRACLFGEVVDDEMRLNANGRLVNETWMGMPRHYPHVELDTFIVMPNHVHGILVLVGSGLQPAPAKMQPLPEIIRGFKTFSARRINRSRSTPGKPVWQRNFYDHIIRDEVGLDRIRQYILDNPVRWAEDPENPARRSDGRGRV